ncbi:MAG TPA: ACT domain-containing protein [Candidatus Thermoplasmatota archaeon]|nr:ACT domain-containing protein [Candidatus Thermoplasmatota archaeon]
MRPQGLFLVSVHVRDEPGALARIARLLAAHNINLRGLMVDATGIHLLTTSLADAQAALDDNLLRYEVQEVHEVLLEDHPGTLADLCERLAQAGINIVTAFGVSAPAAPAASTST